MEADFFFLSQFSISLFLIYGESQEIEVREGMRGRGKPSRFLAQSRESPALVSLPTPVGAYERVCAGVKGLGLSRGLQLLPQGGGPSRSRPSRG